MTDRITVDQMRHSRGEFLDATMGWAVANGIDPATISGRHAVVVVGDTIHYHEIYANADGHFVIDMTDFDSDRQATSYRIAPLLVPMPEAWPACPTCRR